jgi:hypothetical protein
MERAIRFTDPACLPSSAAIFDVPAPCFANLSSIWSSEPVHSLGLGVLIFARVRDSADHNNKCAVANPAVTAVGRISQGSALFLAKLRLIECAIKRGMKTSPLDPHIADVAPVGPALTECDEEHMITYMRLLDADQQGATGVMSLGLCCAATQIETRTGRGGPSKATSRVRDG